MDLVSINENGRQAEVTWCGFTQLRVASVIIGAIYSLVYLSLFSW